MPSLTERKPRRGALSLPDSRYNSIRWIRRVAMAGAGAMLAMGAFAVMIGAQPVRVDPREEIPSLAVGFTLSVPSFSARPAQDASRSAEYRIAGT
jgi:hypothetical protein